MGAGASMQEMEEYLASGVVGNWAAFEAKYACDLDDASKLGEGSFGVVYRCTERASGAPRAVKLMSTDGMSKFELEELHNEVLMLSNVDHANALKMFDYFEDADKATALLVTDCLEGGELFDKILEKAFYSEKDARSVVAVVLELLVYLHEKGIAHRDLKLENLVLRSKDDDTSIKVVDFGLAAHVSNAALMSNQCGTPNYVSPELVTATPPYGVHVDMWALGVIAYVLLAGFPPFNAEDDDDLYADIKKGEFTFDDEFFGAISDDAKDFISKLLVKDVAARLTADHAMLHPWILKGDHDFVVTHLEKSLAKLRETRGRLRGKKRFQRAVVKVRDSLRVSRPSKTDLSPGGLRRPSIEQAMAALAAPDALAASKSAPELPAANAPENGAAAAENGANGAAAS